MGKPYTKEINQLSVTYQWAMKTNIDTLCEAVRGIENRSILAVGSGGSLTAAHIASQLHETYTGNIAKPVTPLELTNSALNLKPLAAIFVSAGGRNIDIINAFKATIEREPQKVIVLCSDTNSPLAKLAREYSFADLVNIKLPSGKDGFLATNSLLAFSVLLARAWATVFAGASPLPSDLRGLVHPDESEELHLNRLREASTNLWEKQTISVLCGLPTKAAAVDFESKFTEAALGSVQIADYRNFAHGRHHWLAKRGEDTGIAAFITDEDRELALKTLNLFPREIPILSINLPFSGDRAMISALVQVIQLCAFAGEKQGIDPGKPGVPDFGRKIYHLRAGGTKNQNNVLNYFEKTVIRRKTEVDVAKFADDSKVIFWKQALHNFVERLTNSLFHGVVFDYDGTLCDASERYTGISNEIAKHLNKLLAAGVTIGIATGRGKSVRNDLQKKIPEAVWKNVVVGYYNGAETISLDDEKNLNETAQTDVTLAALNSIFEKNGYLEKMFSWEMRAKQITLQPQNHLPTSTILLAVQEIIEKNNLQGLSVLYSSHSIDVLAPHVSKTSVVVCVKEKCEASANVLCIGDRGRFPGNDYTLLSEEFSLSVDETSLSPETCWNLAPAGCRGVPATSHYLNSINFQGASFKFDKKRLTEAKKT